MIGGQVGFAGHQKIADGVKIAAQSGIQGDIENENEIVQGSPALNIGDYKRSYVIFRQLPKVKGEVSELRKEIKDLKNKLGS
jgi:UDP-3-O-[3-hydroxymyristoyl] glucosamine N-acyltransferase